MKYAARTEDGRWTGAVYAQKTGTIVAHHAQYRETILPVSCLREVEGGWEADLPTIGEERAVMACSQFQGREILRRDGLYEQAAAVIAASENATLIGAWEEASTWNRLSPFIMDMGDALNLTPEQIDDLFRRAAEIAA